MRCLLIYGMRIRRINIENDWTHPINTTSTCGSVEIWTEGYSNIHSCSNKCVRLLGTGGEISNFHWPIGTTNRGIDMGVVWMRDESLELFEVPIPNVRECWQQTWIRTS